MSDNMLNPHWYRVAKVKLKLHNHIRLHRHVYRDRVWYILQDETSGKHHRYNEATYRFIRLIDGTRTVEEIWDHLCDHYGDDAPTQDEIIQLLGSLYFADCILGNTDVDVAELIDRRKEQRKKLFNAKLMNPVSIRIPLLDPDNFLSRWMPLARPLYSRAASCLIALLFLLAMFETWRNWSMISNHVTENALLPSNLLIMLLVYPLIKGLHELGHAFAVKLWGGDVHEMGVMLLVFMPVPYVDASAATAFPDKQKRMVVSAAGIIVELVLASAALLLWLNIQQGLVSDILFNIMLIGGLSTLLFNGNPLLRFDGYYVLADAIEIPGLGNRANKYLTYLIQKHLFASKQARSPETAEGEKRWFICYGIAALVYRMFIMFSIVLFVAGKYFFIGIALAIWIVIKQLLMPVVKGIQFILHNPSLSQSRQRAILASVAISMLITLSLFTLPVPLNTTTEGVVWMPEHSYVRAGSNGFVTAVVTRNGEAVAPGRTLIVTEDITLNDELDLLRSQLAEAQRRYDAVRQTNLVQAEIINDEIGVIRSNLGRMQERIDENIMHSPTQGVFIIPTSKQLEGQYVKQGDTLAYVIDFDDISVRVAVPQNAIGLVRQLTETVEIRMAGNIANSYNSSVIREIPAATYKLPSKALSIAGGGSIRTDPFDQEGLRTDKKYFQFDISLPQQIDNIHIGQRVHVKFSHGNEALAVQWYRSFSELFLDELGKV